MQGKDRNPLAILIQTHHLNTYQAAKKMGISYCSLRAALAGTQHKLPSTLLAGIVNAGLGTWEDAGRIAMAYETWRREGQAS